MATYWENSCSFGLRYVSWYKCLIVSLVFSHLDFWSENLFLIAPFPDFCLLVPFYVLVQMGQLFKITDIVSLQFVKIANDIITSILLFFVEKCENPLQCKFLTKNNIVFAYVVGIYVTS